MVGSRDQMIQSIQTKTTSSVTKQTLTTSSNTKPTHLAHTTSMTYTYVRATLRKQKIAGRARQPVQILRSITIGHCEKIRRFFVLCLVSTKVQVPKSFRSKKRGKPPCRRALQRGGSTNAAWLKVNSNAKVSRRGSGNWSSLKNDEGNECFGARKVLRPTVLAKFTTTGCGSRGVDEITACSKTPTPARSDSVRLARLQVRQRSWFGRFLCETELGEEEKRAAMFCPSLSFSVERKSPSFRRATRNASLLIRANGAGVWSQKKAISATSRAATDARVRWSFSLIIINKQRTLKKG